MAFNRIAALAAGLALAPLAALAQEADPALDTDGDGAYSLTELQAVYPDLTEESFTTLDLNADGVMGPEELTAALDAGQLPPTGG